jgi:hypothetical protein
MDVRINLDLAKLGLVECYFSREVAEIASRMTSLHTRSGAKVVLAVVMLVLPLFGILPIHYLPGFSTANPDTAHFI